MNGNPVAHSLAKMLLVGLRKTSDPRQREALIAEMQVALEHLAPNVMDMTREAAMLALGRCGVNPADATAEAIAAPFLARQNHHVTIVSHGPAETPHRWECTCGDKGSVWHGERARAVSAGAMHAEVKTRNWQRDTRFHRPERVQ